MEQTRWDQAGWSGVEEGEHLHGEGTPAPLQLSVKAPEPRPELK